MSNFETFSFLKTSYTFPKLAGYFLAHAVYGLKWTFIERGREGGS